MHTRSGDIDLKCQQYDLDFCADCHHEANSILSVPVLGHRLGHCIISALRIGTLPAVRVKIV